MIYRENLFLSTGLLLINEPAKSGRTQLFELLFLIKNTGQKQ
ncbi:hypothetical protein BH10BAC3_BH10BAC3_11010 [soil metagenome]